MKTCLTIGSAFLNHLSPAPEDMIIAAVFSICTIAASRLLLTYNDMISKTSATSDLIQGYLLIGLSFHPTDGAFEVVWYHRGLQNAKMQPCIETFMQSLTFSKGLLPHKASLMNRILAVSVPDRIKR